MKFSELSSRYAKALYERAAESSQQDKVFDDLRALREIFQRDEKIRDFMRSPLIKAKDKEQALDKALRDSGLSDEVYTFMLVLAKKDRLPLFEEIVEAYQAISDESHGVVRGLVRSAAVLNPEDRKKIEETVERVTHKKVILTYSEEPSLIGGLVAEVGTYTFDDSLTSHLRRLKEELNRRAH